VVVGPDGGKEWCGVEKGEYKVGSLCEMAIFTTTPGAESVCERQPLLDGGILTMID